VRNIIPDSIYEEEKLKELMQTKKITMNIEKIKYTIILH
jgi:hypothetical protein